MVLLADKVQILFTAVTERSSYAPFLMTPLGFALSAWLARRYFPNLGSSGIPQVMAAHRLLDQAQR